MNWLQNILPPNWTYALGWTVIHSLWQGVLIASVMAFLMMGLQRKSAALRYRIAFASLLTMFVSALGTFVFLLEKTTKPMPDDFYESLILRGLVFEASVENQSFMERMRLFFNENLYLIVTIWLLGVAFFTLRLMGGLMYVEQLRTRHLGMLPAEWQSRMNFFKNKLGIRYSVALAESAVVSVPMVVGWLKPLILFPIGTVNSLSTGQVEAILTHELAHIASRDYLLNIVQSIIEILFYYHPAAWWISANIRTERENRCDDVAVRICGNSLTYAKALLSLQEMQVQNVRTYGLAMTFAGKNKHFLLNRIKRILNQPQNRSNIMEKLTATALLLAVVTALSFGNNKTLTRSPSDKTDWTAPSVSALISADTLPPKGKLTITKEDDGKKVEMKVENGNITELKIDGKDIPKEDFGQYEDVTDDILYGIATPPVPPTPPTAPMPPTSPMPPMPPSFSAPTPPIPPTPPTPPAFPRTTLKKEKDSEGNTILKMKKADGSISEIKITPDKEVFIDGKKMEEGKDMKLNLGDNTFFYNNDLAHGFNGFDKFDMNMDFVMPRIKLKESEDRMLRRKGKNLDEKIEINIDPKIHIEQFDQPRSFYFNNGDSTVWNHWSDSTMVFRYKNNLKNDLKWSKDDIERIKEDARRLSNEGRRTAKRYQEEAQRLQRDAQRLAREQQRLAQEKMQQYRYNYANDKKMELSDVKKTFEQELKKDGFLKDGQTKYTFELTDKHLKINGKEQSKEMYEKYLNLYGERGRNFTIKFTED